MYNYSLIVPPYAFMPPLENVFLLCTLAAGQKYAQIFPVENIVMYPQDSARRVPRFRRVLFCHCVIVLQATSYLPLPSRLQRHGYFFAFGCRCLGGNVPQGTSKHPVTVF